MANYGHIVVFSLLGGLVSLIGGVILLGNKNWAQKLARYATPFAAGALLSAVFLDLLKDGIEHADTYTVLMFALVGVAAFFVAERLLRWFHHHHPHEDKKSDPTVSLIIFGDTLHNALDGMAIAASFLVSVPTGIVTTLAIAAHEIPQEIGDFGVLLNKGLSRRKVLLVNVLSALATLFAALITFTFAGSEKYGILFGLSAGFLLYVALSDLIPSIHEEAPARNIFDPPTWLFLLGIATVAVSINLAHQLIG